MIKYVIHPGRVESKNDDSFQFFSFDYLIQYYNLNKEECIDAWYYKKSMDKDHLIHIYPEL